MAIFGLLNLAELLRLQKNIKINFWLFFYPINYKRDLHQDLLIIMNKMGVILLCNITEFLHPDSLK